MTTRVLFFFLIARFVFLQAQPCENDFDCTEGRYCVDNQCAVSSKPKKCPVHMHYDECGTACPERCNQPPPEVCIDMCVAGCFCNKGFVLDDNDVCVRRKKCPHMSEAFSSKEPCGPNEHFTSCGTACEPSCKVPKPEVCTLQCIVDVCQCDPNFYRHETKGCVSLDDCNS